MIHSSLISQSIDNALPEDVLQVREILSKAYELQGLTLSDVAALMNVKRPELLNELFHAASDIKEKFMEIDSFYLRHYMFLICV